jgi:hypothetical protein
MAGTAEEAIKTWGRSVCFDVVVSETELSGMDGHEFARYMAVLCPGPGLSSSAVSIWSAKSVRNGRDVRRLRSHSIRRKLSGVLLDCLPAAPKTRIKEISDQVEEFSKVPIRLANLSASMFQMGNGPEKNESILDKQRS